MAKALTFKTSQIQTPHVVIGVLLFIIFLMGIKLWGPSFGDSRIEVSTAKKTQEIAKVLEVDLGKDIPKLQFEVQRAEIHDRIIVSGKWANSVKGRTFLVVSLKLTNNANSPLSLNSKNFVRLSVNGNESELLAPDIHNDPVEVQPRSTKYTRVAFPIDDTASQLKLQVGKVDGQKEIIDLSSL